MEHTLPFLAMNACGPPWRLIGRLYPVVFGGYLRCLVRVGLYWGKINGAGRFDRMRSGYEVVRWIYAFAYCLVFCFLFLYQDAVIGWFSVFHATQGSARDLIRFLPPCFLPFFFQSLLFIAIAVF